jgi:hypothetical protein
MLEPDDVFPKTLGRALRERGRYVYAYYDPDGVQPFYVGKGAGRTVLRHWRKALNSPTKPHEKRIRQILNRGDVPQIQLLAYNLKKNEEEPYTLAERVLQDAFGIKRVWEKISEREGMRRKEKNAALLQVREDSRNKRPLSLEAVVAASLLGKEFGKKELNDLATDLKMPVLLVGLSKTYHPSYSSHELRDMARMYWNLEYRYAGTSLGRLLEGKACLLAWVSELTTPSVPVIVGVWEIEGYNRTIHPGGRYEFPAFEKPKLRKRILGIRLKGTGKQWQGQTIYLGECPPGTHPPPRSASGQDLALK